MEKKMLRTSKQKHSKQCIWSFSWEMGLEADWCPRAAVCCAVLGRLHTGGSRLGMPS